MPYNQIANSTFLDAFGAIAVGPGDPLGYLATLQGNTGNSVSTAQGAILPLLSPGASLTPAPTAVTEPVVNVGVMLARSASPQALDSLLGGDWADRQSFITSQGHGIWSTFGASQAAYADTTSLILQQLGIAQDSPQSPMSLAAAAGYVGSAENRTIWMSLSAAQFNTLFNSVLLYGDAGAAWTGPLSLPDTIDPASIAGLWVEYGILFRQPVLGGGVSPNPAIPPAGPVSPGNSALILPGEQWAPGVQAVDGAVYATPQAVARHYNFPLPVSAATAPIALVEGGLDQPGLLQYLNDYRQILGLPPLTPAQFQLMGATTVSAAGGVELTLDVSVLSGAAPGSTQYLYGAANPANAPIVTVFQAYQNAFFDAANDPGILSSSWAGFFSMTPQSPFQAAWQQLFVDGLLSGVSVHIALGDQGSNGFIVNGGANVPAGSTPAFALAVGGTSIAAPWAAAADPTLAALYARAMHGDRATLFELVEAGLTTLPSKLPQANPNSEIAGASFAYSSTLTRLIETVWNEYSFVPGSSGEQVLFTQNYATSGGVDPTQPTPAYQAAFGLAPGTNPASPNSSPGGSGSGAPDVSALAGGDAFYMALNNAYQGGDVAGTMTYYWGTSAAAPLWATLTAQLDLVFADHRLPPLGFYNDLLYIAAAVAPASFNDITRGNNNSGFSYSAGAGTGVTAITQSGEYPIRATGVGLSAHEGYDLASGLGTPNGLLLARALTQIAHEQMYFDAVPDFLARDGAGWQAGVRESLLFQASTSSAAQVALSLGTQSIGLASSATQDFAWTSRLAQQSLQRDFDPDLVKLFDGFSHGALFQANVPSGADIAVSINGSGTVTPQAGITTSFGFADFTTQPRSTGFDPDVRVALPVAIAETAGGGDGHTAIVRLRQNGENSLAISFFEVDDYTGAIDFGGRIVRPGDAGYAAAAQARAYQAPDGTTAIAGPGHGHFAQAHLLDVDAGDIIAMKLANTTTGAVFWSFANANETINGQPVAHLWNYGANTWGFEDTEGGGDRDFNDLVVGLDFTSSYGNAWLM